SLPGQSKPQRAVRSSFEVCARLRAQRGALTSRGLTRGFRRAKCCGCSSVAQTWHPPLTSPYCCCAIQGCMTIVIGRVTAARVSGLLVALTAAALFKIAAFTPAVLIDDTWSHLATGEWILAHGAVPR